MEMTSLARIQNDGTDGGRARVASLSPITAIAGAGRHETACYGGSAMVMPLCQCGSTSAPSCRVVMFWRTPRAMRTGSRIGGSGIDWLPVVCARHAACAASASRSRARARGRCLRQAGHSHHGARAFSSRANLLKVTHTIKTTRHPHVCVIHPLTPPVCWFPHSSL